MATADNAEESENGSPKRDDYPDDASMASPDPNNATSKSEEKPRQKRKKARRACLACQRAHLTCSDERPCHRCIKRGLEADCTDGMRKKAKYLHDAPNEALMPGVGQNYMASNEKGDSPLDNRSSVANTEPPLQLDGSFSQDQNVAFNGYPQASNAAQLALQSPPSFGMFGPQASPMSAPFNSQQSPPMAHMSASMQPPMDGQAYATPFLDPNDPSMFNFDLAGMNFGNHYGALEFGMLGHMSSGANDTALHRNSSSNFEPHSMNIGQYVANSPEANNYIYNRQGSATDWQAHPARQGLSADQWGSHRGNLDHVRPAVLDEPSAYSIGAAAPSATGTSPGSTGAELGAYERQLMGSTGYPKNSQRPRLDRQQSQAQDVNAAIPPQRGEDGPSATISKKLEKIPQSAVPRKRPRDPSKIYSTVTKPYPYTLGFHALTALLQRRFSSQKRLRIAQALASIRPSFISCTRTLIDDDLIFMEKCFQRQLWEYDNFVSACGTPTIVCRRTGEVAYVGKEFTTLTGWRKPVLLGIEPNLNVNKGSDDGANSGTHTGSSRGGVNTPRMTAEGVKLDADRPQSVFLAELLDDDSVIEFYEDFAKLAFADSKGSACKPCRLLKYKTKEDPISRLSERKGGIENGASGAGQMSRNRASPEFGRRKMSGPSAMSMENGKKNDGAVIGGEAGINKLGDKDGKVDCMYCWTVKRDVFDIPMMIVINFLPILT